MPVDFTSLNERDVLATFLDRAGRPLPDGWPDHAVYIEPNVWVRHGN